MTLFFFVFVFHSLQKTDYLLQAFEGERSFKRMFDTLEALTYKVSAQGPTMIRPGGKFSNSRSTDAWKRYF